MKTLFPDRLEGSIPVAPQNTPLPRRDSIPATSSARQRTRSKNDGSARDRFFAIQADAIAKIGHPFHGANPARQNKLGAESFGLADRAFG